MFAKKIVFIVLDFFGYSTNYTYEKTCTIFSILGCNNWTFYTFFTSKLNMTYSFIENYTIISLWQCQECTVGSLHNIWLLRIATTWNTLLASLRRPPNWQVWTSNGSTRRGRIVQMWVVRSRWKFCLRL